MVTIAPTCNSEYKVILTRRQTENILYFIFIPCFTAGIGTSGYQIWEGFLSLPLALIPVRGEMNYTKARKGWNFNAVPSLTVVFTLYNVFQDYIYPPQHPHQ